MNLEFTNKKQCLILSIGKVFDSQTKEIKSFFYVLSLASFNSLRFSEEKPELGNGRPISGYSKNESVSCSFIHNFKTDLWEVITDWNVWNMFLENLGYGKVNESEITSFIKGIETNYPNIYSSNVMVNHVLELNESGEVRLPKITSDKVLFHLFDKIEQS